MNRLLVLSLLAALAAACGGGSGSTPPPGTGTGAATGPADAQVFVLRATDRDQYQPATVTARVGTLTLSLRSGGVPHDLQFAEKAFGGISAVSGDAAKSTTLHFDKPGTFDFECTIHPGMAGRVVVS